MSIAHIQERLLELAKAHHAIDDPGLDELKDAEIIEAQAKGLILDHCRSQSHLPDKAVPMAAQQRVLDRLALEKDDVAETTELKILPDLISGFRVASNQQSKHGSFLYQ
jgi:hypothetical protein